MSAPPPKPRKPRGKAIAFTDQALDRAAIVTPDDLPAAVRHWESFCPPIARGLLDATTYATTAQDGR
jgi:hypothetical protein